MSLASVHGVARGRKPRPHLGCALLALSLVGLVGCTVPPHMQVRSGTDPDKQDDNVRFRTTYYFRVFDYCEGDRQRPDYTNPHVRSASSQAPTRNRRVEIDSLYRFRMTGKANALSNKVHFESGTLKAWQIDPFGNSIQFDRDLGRFTYVSQEETREAKRIEDAYRDIERLTKLRENYDGEDQKDSAAAIDRAIRQRIAELGGSSARSATTLLTVNQANELANRAKRLAGKAMNAADQLPTADKNALNAQLTGLGSPVASTAPLQVLRDTAKQYRDAGKVFGDVASREETEADKQRKAQESSQAQSDWQQKETEYREAAKVLMDDRAETDANSRLLQAAASVLWFGPAFEWTTPDAFEAAREYLRSPATSAVLTPQQASAVGDAVGYLETLRDDSLRIAARFEAGSGLAQAASRLADVARTYEATAGGAGTPAGTARAAAASRPDICGDGRPLRRGFQVLGPEGWRTFDQDDRLIMAMSSEAKPLIGALQEISGRMLREQSPSSEQLLLPVVEERLRLSNGLRAVDTFSGENPDALMAAVLQAFGAEGGTAQNEPGE